MLDYNPASGEAKYDLHGTCLINKEGNYLGILDYYIFNPDNNKYIIHYISDNHRYKDNAVKKDNFEMYRGIAKIKSERYILLRNRNINHLYHFSPVENTSSILKNGILSREAADMLDISYKYTDPCRLDGELNRVCTSISFPNYKMKYPLENQGYNFMIYDIKPEILLTKLDTQFYYTNAANGFFYDIDKNTLATNEALEDMFYEEDREPNLEKFYTTDPQAEALISDAVPIEYINGIVANYYDEEIRKACKEKELTFTINNRLHKYRKDFARWK